MRNTTCVQQVHHCYQCKVNGFFITTPDGADYETCPCCGKGEYLSYKNQNNDKYAFLYEDEYENDMRSKYDYCDQCNIIFDVGCLHHNGGCTDNVFNAHFIKRWRHKETNEEFDGMPLFEGPEDWFQHANEVEVLEMYCPHQGNICKKTYHPIERYKCVPEIPTPFLNGTNI